MSDDLDHQSNVLSDNWLTSWEDQCIQEWESSTNMEDRIQQNDSEQLSQRLWLTFQNSASAIAELYRDRSQGSALWVPFQNSASAVTLLYKESLENMKRNQDLGMQCGHHRRSRDLIAWAKKKRRHIRREDLIAHLCGKNPPPRHKPSATMSRPSFSPLERSSPRLPTSAPAYENTEPDLRTFRDALAIQGLNGAMSNISMGYRPHSHSSSGAVTPARPCGNMDDIQLCILDELSRHCDNSRKRTATPTDVRMDSPTRKKSRLF